MKKIFGVLLLIVVFLTTGCEKTSNADDCTLMDMGVEGVITEITYTDDVITNILVRGESKQEDNIYLYDYASVSIVDNTKVYRDNVEVSVNELKEGMTVRVIFQGAVAESYPVQAEAFKIYIK